ncbi:hypothetical protein E2C01_064477 [Portunus trituberculatus]|uniref:Uncharacterized protein n=1 Tax=Portunus trituberculatus TaxID=210409 RepID=A0A5B7HKY2_PORTR|nr:hypothetical protein [Portunus trituberculatus]
MFDDSIYSSPPGYRASAPFSEQGHHGGTVILVRQDIPIVRLELNSPLHVVAVKLFRQSPGRQVALLSVPFLSGTQHALKLCKRNGRLARLR